MRTKIFEHFKEKKPLTATRYKQASSFILIQKFMTMQLREKTDNLFCSAPKNLHLVDNMHNHQCSIQKNSKAGILANINSKIHDNATCEILHIRTYQ